jgi:valyl-tRNA synthetase
MDNIRDWCVSRQIWWGHRIPAWYCRACGAVQVAKEAPMRCSACDSDDLVQETDVLDTWFSSALWPFSTLGWPDPTPELKTFYPTSALVTGFDILFFWVARMMMMGIHFMGDIPFRDVYIHALVRDAEGKKMSKSKGNVIDPLAVMDQFGTDAFRFTLAALAAQGRDIKLSEERILGYRHFVNKIWNAARFALMNLEEGDPPKADPTAYTLADRWILTRLGQVSEKVAGFIEAYQFNEAAGLSYQFVWHELCDWYLEMAKEALYGEDGPVKETARAVVQETLVAALKLLHPFMPFVTEDIWQRLPGTDGSIMTARFPDPAEFPRDEAALKEMDLLMGVITAIRNIRGEMNIPPSKNVHIVIDTGNRSDEVILDGNLSHIRSLAKVDEAAIGPGLPKPDKSATAVFEQTSVHVILKGLIDFKEEERRVKKEISRTQKEMEASQKKLSNRGFLEKAPEEIVADVKAKADGLASRLSKLQQNLSFLETLDD